MKKRVFLLFTCALLTVFTLSGQGLFGGLTNKEEPKITETDFKTLLDGFWEGEGSQLGTKWSMELYYDNNAKYFTIRYPSLSCVGRWEITKVSQKVLIVKETITDGKGNCKKEGEVRIRFVSANEVKMEFYEINGLIPLAKASLSKTGPYTFAHTTTFKTLATGYWEGEAESISEKWAIQLHYDAPSNTIDVNYPILQCSGKWKSQHIGEKSLGFISTIENGDHCAKDLDITVFYIDANTLDIRFHRPNTPSHFAYAKIYKRDKFTEIEIPKRNPNYDDKTMSGWKTFFLYGKVKQVTYSNGDYIVFNQNGNVSKQKSGSYVSEKIYQNANSYMIKGDDEKYTISFDGNERRDLWQWGGEFDVEGFYYSFDNDGRCIKIISSSIRNSWTQEYLYKGDEPFPYQSKYQTQWEEGSVEITSNYTYIRFDEQGNWTERKVDKVIVDSAYDYATDKEKKTTTKESYTETQKFIYF